MINKTLFEGNESQPLPPEYSALSDKRILVTGAAGFIGGALFKRLNEYGLNVLGTVLYEGEKQALEAQGFEVEILDLASNESFEEQLKGVDLVFNIAAMFQEVECSDDMYYKVNVDGTLKLLKESKHAGVERFVHCSTVGVHGHVKEIPCTEESPFNPMDVYHKSKLAGEIAVLDYAKSISCEDMTVKVNRPAMVYGPGDERMLKIFKSIASRTFIMIGSGETLAHLGYIEDQVDSFLLGAVAPAQTVHCETFNIASDRHITLNEMAQLIARDADVSLPKFKIPVAPVWFAGLLCEIICKPFGIKPPLFRRRVGFFTHNRSFSLNKAETLLGFRSKVSNKQGIERTMAWYRDHGFIDSGKKAQIAR